MTEADQVELANYIREMATVLKDLSTTYRDLDILFGDASRAVIARPSRHLIMVMDEGLSEGRRLVTAAGKAQEKLLEMGFRP